jgi:predicted ATPase
MNFFVVSAGKPGSDYIEDNFEEIIKTKEFALHENTQQKGTYFSIESGDVLILKYEREYVAYGIVNNRFKKASKDFSLRAKVDEWIFFKSDNPRKGVSSYGIQKATIGGGGYGTVKTVRPNFGLDKIREINNVHPTFNLISDQYKETSSNLKKDGDYFKLHEELFNYLLDITESDSEFTFVIRDSNNKGSLDSGYWFYGEETVAISFWTGMDYINRRPAISFLVNANEHCKLVIQTDIYQDLRDYLSNENNYLSAKLSLTENNKIYEKEYSNYQLTDYKDCLSNFLKNDYPLINRIFEDVNNGRGEDFEFNDSNIKKFPINEFNLRLNNLFRYRQSDSPELTLYSIEDENRADSLKEISIKDYGLIKDELLIFGNSKWIFITGENGSGKTMLIRAIGSALGNRTLEPKELIDKNFTVKAELLSDGRTIPFFRNRNENVRAKRAIISRGLAMYGPYRLQQTSGLVKDETFRKALSKKGSFESLFEDGSKLLSFDKQLELWTSNSKTRTSDLEYKMKQVLSLLPRLIPDLRIVNYKRRKYNKYDFEYLIQTPGSDELTSLKWHELSSGNKNILNLVSDIIIRLFHQQPKITDPSELRGIILIDEIDLHLHPKAQRDLVVMLSETFPMLQFIVTTHSPIPLLGAPKNSKIYVTKRDWNKGVHTQRIDDKIYLEELLPNTILSSPIFGMDDITNDNREKGTLVRTEKTFADVEFIDKLENKIEEFITDKIEKALIERFENKRK